MDTTIKLEILADAAKYDASCASSGAKRKRLPGGLGHNTGSGICHSYTPDGRCVSLLKILLTNHCIYDCRYCVNRVSNDVRRASFTVDEVVRLTVDFYKRNYIEGLFLSSGIIRSSDHTMGLLAEVARRLRVVERFNGYIHLKAVAGASEELLQRAGRHADRLSANIELPTQPDLDRFAPDKTIAEAESSMASIKSAIDGSRETPSHRGTRPPRVAPAGQSTQMIVGATPTPDRTLLATTDHLYKTHRLKRVYFTGYSPVPEADPGLPAAKPPLVREHRLYQADWLLRFYGFGVGELVTQPDGNLDLELDPKTAWALQHRGLFPVDVNTAPRELLLRVPGLGVKSVGKLLAARRYRRVRRVDLVKLRAPLRRVLPFVKVDDDRTAAMHLDDATLRNRLIAPGGRAGGPAAVAVRGCGVSGATRTVTIEPTYAAWRDAARGLFEAGVPADAVDWREAGADDDADGGLFGGGATDALPLPRASNEAPPLRVPRAFVSLAKDVACFRDASVWPLLYRLLLRVQRHGGALLNDALDDDVVEAKRRRQAVRRDAHKMHAFVRFRRVESPEDPDGERFVAFHKPLHRITRREAGFFRERFHGMAWSILTPDASIHWDTRRLTHGPGTDANPVDEDAVESLWLTYYASVFNPARANRAAMLNEMPQQYWETMPEAALIEGLLRGAEGRRAATSSETLASAGSAADYLPREARGGWTLPQLAEAAAGCAGCELCGPATQTVFGEGPADARVMLVGEQPGDREDEAGRPFVGPAGTLLDAALAEAGVDRGGCYVTNAVKHFNFAPRGKRRTHAKPLPRHAAACRPWLDAELSVVRPRVLVAMGATAAQQLFGSTFRITQRRGEPIDTSLASAALATWHPAAILRAQAHDPARADTMHAQLVDDLRRAASWVAARTDSPSPAPS